MKILKIEDNITPIDTWGMEIEECNEYCMGNGMIVHNTSGKISNATEACEPVLDLFYLEIGTNNLPTVVNGIKEYGQYYERCWDIDPKRILELAAIRQIYLDQAQSFNQYYKKAESLSDLYEDLRYAESLGIKSLYYFKQPKSEAELECSSCSV